MLDLFRFDLVPGRYFVLATLLPLLPVVLLLITATVRNLTRATRNAGGSSSTIYWLLGGDQPLHLGGYLSLICMIGSAVLAILGAKAFAEDLPLAHSSPLAFEARWAEKTDWLRIGPDIQEPSVAALPLGYRLDRLSIAMFVMVSCIGSMIFLFSFGYMRGELAERVPIEDHARGGASTSYRRGRFSRFFLYLSLFAFSMFHLLIADNLFQMFISWELVGVCSFFLIGFYYEKHSAGIAANKAFIMNRIGDAGFLVAIGILFAHFGTLNIAELSEKFQQASLYSSISEMNAIVMGLGLFLGCVGKSAQVPLQTWLPDAMEGPTPVSALIHAATMVAAGVYLVGRCYLLFVPDVLHVIAAVGLVTLVISATSALVNTDIKRVLAFSTCSQLGYMMLALGIGAWTAGLLHLITHACFKALLFLGAGSVIHGLQHEQDLRKMGGLRRKMPITAYTMLIGVLAISGVPLLAGWYSKDRMLAGMLGTATATGNWLFFVLPWLTAALTAFYMFRLWFLAFAGTPRDKQLHEHAHESPATMTIPLVVLALLSIGVAWGWPVWNVEASELGHVLHAQDPTMKMKQFEASHEAEHHHHLLAGGLALLATIAGTTWAWLRYGRQAPSAGQLAEPQGLFANRWYFDAIYDALFVRSTIQLARSSASFDKSNPEKQSRFSLDSFWNAIGDATVRSGFSLRRLQTGLVRNYVLALMIAVVGVLGVVVIVVK